MARPRSAHYPEIRAQILEEAARLFAGQGFAGTSIAGLATACGFSKAALYHYFDSKEAILEALLLDHLADLLALMRESMDGEGDARAQFRRFVAASMAVYARTRDKHVVLMNDLERLPEDARARVRRQERDLVDRLADLLARIHPSLVADRRLRMPYTMMFFGLLNWTYVWFDEDGPLAPAEFADRAADLFLDGFLAAAPAPAEADAAE